MATDFLSSFLPSLGHLPHTATLKGTLLLYALCFMSTRSSRTLTVKTVSLHFQRQANPLSLCLKTVGSLSVKNVSDCRVQG